MFDPPKIQEALSVGLAPARGRCVFLLALGIVFVSFFILRPDGQNGMRAINSISPFIALTRPRKQFNTSWVRPDTSRIISSGPDKLSDGILSKKQQNLVKNDRNMTNTSGKALHKKKYLRNTTSSSKPQTLRNRPLKNVKPSSRPQTLRNGPLKNIKPSSKSQTLRNDRLQVLHRACNQCWVNKHKPGCSRFKFNGSSSKLFARILVDDKHKTLFCEVPSVKSSAWRLVFSYLLNRETKGSNPGGMPTGTPSQRATQHDHKQKSSHTIGLKYLNSFSPHEIKSRLEKYFAFMFVRDPFERLALAFEQVFSPDSPFSKDHQTNLREMITYRFRINARKDPVRKNNRPVNFEEFARFAIDSKQNKQIADPLWDSQVSLCNPCLVNYQFIGKIESLHDDFTVVLNNIAPNVTLTKAQMLQFNMDKVDSRPLKKYLTRLDKGLSTKIYEAYLEDFQLFNYAVT